MKKGRLFVLCGLDGSGKSSQVKLLHNRLRNDGYIAHVTKQPTDEYRKKRLVRQYLDGFCRDINPRILALLSAADRLNHIDTVVKPRITKNEVVICNRYVYSAFAYFQARGVEMKFLETINSGYIVPDATFLIDVPAEECLRRLNERDGGHLKFEEKQEGMFEQIRSNFLAMQDHNYYVLDGVKSVEEVHDDVYSIVAGIL